MKLIDKDALLAEIERLMCSLFPNFYEYDYDAAKVELLEKIEEFIDTLEVKEMDLEKELIEWHKEHFKKDGTFIGKSGFYLTNNSQMDIAKHFFELGLKVQKGE